MDEPRKRRGPNIKTDLLSLGTRRRFYYLGTFYGVGGEGKDQDRGTRSSSLLSLVNYRTYFRLPVCQTLLFTCKNEGVDTVETCPCRRRCPFVVISQPAPGFDPQWHSVPGRVLATGEGVSVLTRE